jgi:hypothetical protein
MNLSWQSVLDLTDNAVAEQWRYVADAGRDVTRSLAEKAVGDGYNVIK